MKIGELSQKAGVSAKVIRHYESIGVIGRADRTASGYRRYDEADVHVLRFVKRARSLGFSTAETKALVGLWKNERRASAAVKALALQHIEELERKIAELQGMADTLRFLARNCRGDSRPDCPILQDLENA